MFKKQEYNSIIFCIYCFVMKAVAEEGILYGGPLSKLYHTHHLIRRSNDSIYVYAFASPQKFF